MNATGFAKFHYPRFVVNIRVTERITITEHGTGFYARYGWKSPFDNFHIKSRRNPHSVINDVTEYLHKKFPGLPDSAIDFWFYKSKKNGGN